MKKQIHGPSLYFASDKNIFDALNQHKVNISTISKLFERRNIVISKHSPKDELAKYFSRLPHDFYDHKEIAGRLGVAPRRERITSMDVTGAAKTDQVLEVASELKKELEKSGDIVQLSRDGDKVTIDIQYTSIDYKKSEFTQVQTRDGTVELHKVEDGFTIRNTQNEYINDVRDTLINKLDKTLSEPLNKVQVALFDILSPNLRSKFFYDLAHKLPNFTIWDVTDVYVYKAKPDDGDTDSSAVGDLETHVERVFLRGNGVARSELLNELLDKEDYYITKIRWLAKQVTGGGKVFDIEAIFSDPHDCTGFSFILFGVFPVEKGKVSSKRLHPSKDEVELVSNIIEEKSRGLVEQLRKEFSKDLTEVQQ